MRHAPVTSATEPRGERGASLVEFAILAPLLVLLILGIVEFGWIFGQFNDVRHGAREGARFAAVDGGNNAAIRTRVCEAMEGLGAGITALTVQLDPDPDADTDLTIGEPASIAVEATISGLTGAPLLSSFLPSTLGSDIEFRLEQPPSWTADATPVAVTC
ncbi:MAG: TadE/TadG family type IV pilus assembly protein [Acidimicrobiia bacterium]|nr:TadE/TadG family type IV pilus assembly protein [Acidimicrobiia bacterium]